MRHFPCQCRSLWPIIVLDGVQSVSSIVYQCIYVQFPRVQFSDSRLNLISSWMVDIVDGGHPVMAWLATN